MLYNAMYVRYTDQWTVEAMKFIGRSMEYKTGLSFVGHIRLIRNLTLSHKCDQPLVSDTDCDQA